MNILDLRRMDIEHPYPCRIKSIEETGGFHAYVLRHHRRGRTIPQICQALGAIAFNVKSALYHMGKIDKPPVEKVRMSVPNAIKLAELKEKGCSTKEIAEEMNLTYNVVAYHLARAGRIHFEKLVGRRKISLKMCGCGTRIVHFREKCNWCFYGGKQ